MYQLHFISSNYIVLTKQTQARHKSQLLQKHWRKRRNKRQLVLNKIQLVQNKIQPVHCRPLELSKLAQQGHCRLQMVRCRWSKLGRHRTSNLLQEQQQLELSRLIQQGRCRFAQQGRCRMRLQGRCRMRQREHHSCRHQGWMIELR